MQRLGRYSTTSPSSCASMAASPRPRPSTNARWMSWRNPSDRDIHGSQVASSLAGLYHVQGRLVDAEPLYGRSLAIRESALGPVHRLVAASLNNLAEFYRGQGRYAEAEPLHKRSLEISEKVLGPEHPDVGLILSNLTELYRARAGTPRPSHSMNAPWRSCGVPKVGRQGGARLSRLRPRDPAFFERDLGCTGAHNLSRQRT